MSLLNALCLALLFLPGCSVTDPVQVKVYPGASWEVRTPAEVGLDASELYAMGRAVGGSGVVVKDGFLVYQWGKPTARGDWGSALKPVVNTLLLFAIQEGKIEGPDQHVAPFVERAFGRPLAGKDEQITFRDLANMLSGYAKPEPPGEAWSYSDVGFSLYLRVLLDGVFGESAERVALHPSRLGALEFEDGGLFGSRGGYGVDASPRDFARIGWLWLNEGRWRDRQLIDRELFRKLFRTHVPTSIPRSRASSLEAGSDYLDTYFIGGVVNGTCLGPGVFGMNLWFNTEAQMWPALPADAYQANGHWNGHVVTVIPSLGIVAAWHASIYHKRDRGFVSDPDGFHLEMNRHLSRLADALLEPADTIPRPVAMQAENMRLDGYVAEGSVHGAGIGLTEPYGVAEGAFEGRSGRYDVIAAYYDEMDGEASLRLSIGERQVAAWRLTADLGSPVPSDRSRIVMKLATDVAVAHGDPITITGVADGGEAARVDYLQFIPTSKSAAREHDRAYTKQPVCAQVAQSDEPNRDE